MPNPLSAAPSAESPLDRARKKAYWRLLPLLFACYVIAYVDRANVAIAKLTMTHDLPGFDNAVIGFGAGVFFWGYFLLEIPGTLIVERWSARKWICRIMVSWGFMAALTAFVGHPLGISQWIVDGWNSLFGAKLGVAAFQFYAVRFMLGLAEAGFFPGIIVYLTHWFPARDRTRALALFFVATPVAQVISPKISNALLKIGTEGRPDLLGLVSWQWVYIFWGIPAVVLGVMVLLMLKDRPRDAHWLTTEEREALEHQIEIDHAAGKKNRMTVLQAISHPMVLLLALAYFCSVTGTYGIEFFLPSILQQWYNLKLDAITWLVLLPPLVALGAQLFVGWNSDRTHERRFHSVIPLVITVIALGIAPLTRGSLPLTILCFMIGFGGLKAYLPAFWSLPSLFLTGSAAAGSIGLINSLGNLGGFAGPTVIGFVQKMTGSFVGGIYYLCFSIGASACIIFFLGLGRKEAAPAAPAPNPTPTSTKA